MMRSFQVLFALACTLWAAYVVRLLLPFHLSHPEAPLTPAFTCLMLLVVLPSVVSYVLLFRAIPGVLNRVTGSHS